MRLTPRPEAVSGFRPLDAGMDEPFDMLAACHERVERMLALLTRLQQHLRDKGPDESARQAARDVMRYFDLAAPLHHQDEELHVFPPLLNGPDAGLRTLVQRLVEDHRDMEVAWLQARQVLQAVAETATLEQALPGPTEMSILDRFAALYGRHLADEDLLAYPAAQALLSAQALQVMSRDMMKRRGAHTL